MSRPEDRRQEVWDALGARRTFKAEDLCGRERGASRAGASRMQVQEYLSGWEVQGAVRKVGQDAQGQPIYERNEASTVAPPMPQPRRGKLSDEQARNLWTAMRLMKTFGTSDLVGQASTGAVWVTHDDARLFCQMLRQKRIFDRAEEGGLQPGRRQRRQH